MYYCSIAVPTSEPTTLVASRFGNAPLLGTPSAVADQSQQVGFFADTENLKADTENLEAATQDIPIASMENLQCGAHSDDGPVRITSAESQDKSSTGTEHAQGRILATMENLDGLR